MSQLYDRWRTERGGSSSPYAMEPSAAKLQHTAEWTATTSVQWRNAIVVSFLPLQWGIVGSIKWTIPHIICVFTVLPVTTTQFCGPFHLVVLLST